jgi:hypothetical protein
MAPARHLSFSRSPRALRSRSTSLLAPTEVGSRPDSARLPSTHQCENTSGLAVPRRGHVLSTVAEVYGHSIRQAVGILTRSFPNDQSASLQPNLFSSQHLQAEGVIRRSATELAAWNVVSKWITGVAIGALPLEASLDEAELWFSGSQSQSLSALLSKQVASKAELALRCQANPSAYLELLPYILDPHGPGSRLSVRRNPDTRATRTRKRAEGIFYTPADVADYMVGACLDSMGLDVVPTVFDPACGTGVFLRAALKKLRQLYPGRDAFALASGCLFGADIDPWSLDATAFVLLADVRRDTSLRIGSPAESWERIRLNLACIDAIQLEPSESERAVRKHGSSGSERPSSAGSSRLRDVLPTLAHEPTIIIGNPPYADLGDRSDLIELGHRLQTIAAKPQSNAEIYLAFVEQMIRLADRRTCAGALVLPLSIACNVGPQFVAARELIAKTPGQWRFAFFDREPHALFGEDVKTRNAIVLWSRAPSDKDAAIATGLLRKWRGNNRAAMFKSLRFTPIGSSIRLGLPKIEGHHQATALKLLNARWNRLEHAVQAIERLSLKAAKEADERTVFVGPTAYNFLNVFLRPHQDAFGSDQTLSEHPLHAVRCSSPADASAVFAILSSHFAYWWWHSHGDGFHVSRRFIAALPFGLDALLGPAAESLAECGEILSTAIKARPIISLNGGRTSLAYTPNGHDQIRRMADEALAGLAGLPMTFVDELQQFTARSISATLHETTNAEMEGV